MVNEPPIWKSLNELIGLLEPIADQDWHGKWRIQKAIAIVRQHQAEHMEDNLKMVPSPDIVMSDELVERVARALWEKQKAIMGPAWFHPSERWEGIPYGAQNEWIELAKAAIAVMGEGMSPKALKASDAGLGVISASASPANDKPDTCPGCGKSRPEGSDSWGCCNTWEDREQQGGCSEQKCFLDLTKAKPAPKIPYDPDEQMKALFSSGYSGGIEAFKRKLADATPEEGKFYRLMIDVLRDGNEIFVADELLTGPEKACEIPEHVDNRLMDIKLKATCAACDAYEIAPDWQSAFEGAWKVLLPYLRTTEPVSRERSDWQTVRKALAFYADPGDYVSPLTGGLGKLYFDCGTTAKEALAIADSHAAGVPYVD